jgi:hypothetical protein
MGTHQGRGMQGRGMQGRTPLQAFREGIVQSATEEIETGTDEPQATAA